MEVGDNGQDSKMATNFAIKLRGSGADNFPLNFSVLLDVCGFF
jgi:hypothetical protein